VTKVTFMPTDRHGVRPDAFCGRVRPDVFCGRIINPDVGRATAPASGLNVPLLDAERCWFLDARFWINQKKKNSLLHPASRDSIQDLFADKKDGFRSGQHFSMPEDLYEVQ
jgi:hypothetical protein